MGKSKKTGKSKKKLTKKIPLDKLGEFCEGRGFKKRVFYNKYPIRDGYSITIYSPPEQPAREPKRKQIISEVYEDGEFRKKVSWELEQFPLEILDKKKKQLVQYFTEGELDGLLLGEFLRQHCNVQNPKTMTWEQIITTLIIFAKKNNISLEDIEQYPKTTWKRRNLEEKTTNKLDENNAYIEKQCSAWGFGFNSGTAQVKFKPNKELKGLALIEFLLAHPNEEYTPLELLKKTGQRGEGETESEKIYTDANIRKLKNDIESLDCIAKSTTDLEKKEELEQKVEDAKAILHEARNCMGESRRFSEGNRLSVIRNIGTVLNKIAPQHKELFNHLNTFLNRGEMCCYKPDKDFIWEIH